MYQTLSRLALASVLWIFLSPAIAIDFYDVEILIFLQLDQQGDDEAVDLPTVRYLDLNLELENLLKKASEVNLEPAIDGYLMESVRRLDANPNYQILYHGRWSQTNADLKSAPYVRINLPSIYESHALDGVIRLFATDLLYVDAILRYKPVEIDRLEKSPNLLTKTAGPYYFIQERRRVKFREIHFLDHPKFGMLLGVWPINLPEQLPTPPDKMSPPTKTTNSELVPLTIDIEND